MLTSYFEFRIDFDIRNMYLFRKINIIQLVVFFSIKCCLFSFVCCFVFIIILNWVIPEKIHTPPTDGVLF